jgi:hypothetical protein
MDGKPSVVVEYGGRKSTAERLAPAIGILRDSRLLVMGICSCLLEKPLSVIGEGREAIQSKAICFLRQLEWVLGLASTDAPRLPRLDIPEPVCCGTERSCQSP